MRSVCNQKILTLSKIRKYMNEATALKLYKSLILSVVDYGAIMYLGAPKNELCKIQIIQNKTLRIIHLASRYTANVYLHQRFKVLVLFMRRDNNLLKMVHTYILHNVNSQNLPWLPNVEVRTTRQTSAPYLPLPLSRSKRYTDSCAYRAPKLWLELDSAIRSVSDQNSS